MGHHVFISYSRKDQPYARKLADDLHTHGFEPWRDEHIEHGERWWRAIDKAIRGCAAFVVVMTPESEASKWVEREILLAEREEKPIFPLLLRGKGHALLIEMQYADVAGGLMPPKAFYDRLQRALPIVEQVTEQAEKKSPPKPDKAVPSLPSTYTNSIGMEFVLIPAGTFEMGSNKGDDDERPVHTVEITEPFYLGKYPVMQAEWEAVMGGNPSDFEGANRPVDSVSWDDAQEFIRKLQEKDGGDRYRMPTEAEWEYACRAGEGDAYERDLDAVAWYDENSGDETHPVGEKQPNAWGLYDMLGSVWEWVQDRYKKGYYERSPRQDPQGPEKGKTRMLRGGAFLDVGVLVRCSARLDGYPYNRFNFLGFRVVFRPLSVDGRSIDG